MTPPKPDSLYVHIPFCSSICPYCDFPKVYYRKDWAKDYLKALKNEIKARSQGLFSTIFVGGGTPSCLQKEDLEELLSFLRPYLREGGEFSFEANPESLSEEKIALLSAYGVNRVSIGAQSTTQKSLNTLGRNHDFALVKKRVEQLRGQGISNINVDWMYGFPNQSEGDLRQDIANFLSLGVPHISAYSLILEEGTAYSAKGIAPLEDDVQQAYFVEIREALKKEGFERYEVSNFAKAGRQCRHNLTYWKDLPYVGAGLGAAGYIGNKRYKNTRNLVRYLQGKTTQEEEELNQASELEDFFLTNLRLVEGFELKAFEERFGFPFLPRYQEKAQRLISKGLLEIGDGRVKTSERGMDLLDTVLVELF